MTAVYRSPAAESWSLVWVLVDGRPRHVSEFSGLAPRRRPRALCPECGDVVTLKLGRIRRFHAAHAPNSVCAAVHPETALHLSCKLALADALDRALTSAQRDGRAPPALSFVRRCAGPMHGPSTRCHATSVDPLVEDWDAVSVERRVSREHRPDVALLHAGTPVAALEIRMTHAVSDEKALALQSLGLPWIELAATEQRTAVDGWHLDQPFDVLAEGGRAPWRCAAHRAPLRAARVLDVYRPDGRRDRLIFRITEIASPDRALRLACDTRVIATIPFAHGEPDRRAVRDAFDAELRRLTGVDGSFSDSPMRWANGDAAENIVENALFDHVGRDPTPLATTFPRRWFFAEARAQWFLPRDMRDVRWDRPANDVFAPHPAARRAALTVREPAVPESAWGQPMLASRPHGAMFGYNWPSTPAGDGVAIVEVRGVREARRSIVVVEHALNDQRILDLDRDLTAAARDPVWLVHPLDWSPALANVTWAIAGRDARGRGAVLVDDVGVFRAERFARAIAKEDSRLEAAALRRAMNARGRRLASRQ